MRLTTFTDYTLRVLMYLALDRTRADLTANRRALTNVLVRVPMRSTAVRSKQRVSVAR